MGDEKSIELTPHDPIEVTEDAVAAIVAGVVPRVEVPRVEISLSKARELFPAATRAEATELWDYKRLAATGRDVENHGKGRLVITYAGCSPERVQIRCKSGKAAKRTQMMLRRDLRRAENDEQYNAIIKAFFAAIIAAQEEEVQHG